jgi:hypothetical protein
MIRMLAPSPTRYTLPPPSCSPETSLLYLPNPYYKQKWSACSGSYYAHHTRSGVAKSVRTRSPGPAAIVVNENPWYPSRRNSCCRCAEFGEQLTRRAGRKLIFLKTKPGYRDTRGLGHIPLSPKIRDLKGSKISSSHRQSIL